MKRKKEIVKQLVKEIKDMLLETLDWSIESTNLSVLNTMKLWMVFMIKRNLEWLNQNNIQTLLLFHDFDPIINRSKIATNR